MRPIAIDLFAGVGGMSLGFEQAGFDVCAAVEIDPVHCAAHEFNFPECAVIPRSIVGLSAEDIRNAARIGSRPVDCVFGGPPCQGFSKVRQRDGSNSGPRMIEDKRRYLYREFLRYVDFFQPKVFVMENV